MLLTKNDVVSEGEKVFDGLKSHPARTSRDDDGLVRASGHVWKKNYCFSQIDKKFQHFRFLEMDMFAILFTLSKSDDMPENMARVSENNEAIFFPFPCEL